MPCWDLIMSLNRDEKLKFDIERECASYGPRFNVCLQAQGMRDSGSKLKK